MHIFLTGGTGFIGSHLVQRLLSADHCLTIITRSTRQSSRPGLTYLQGDPRKPGKWQEVLAEHDAVINLAGASLFRPWTEKNKRLIRDSRLATTAAITEALSREKSAATVLINASAIGYYGDRGDIELDEQADSGNDFLADLSVDWEREAEKNAAFDIRVVRCRFGIVLGPGGGALAKMLPVFKWGLGSPLGSGNQWFSWIHLHDLISIILFLLERRELSGPVNCTAPNPVTNKELTRTLAAALHRPAFLPAIPSFVLKAAMGESSRMLLASQKVMPRRLLEHGFNFTYANLESALEQIINQ